MQLSNWPTYCGGRILTGLYDDRNGGKDKLTLKQYSDPHTRASIAHVPRDINVFQKILAIITSNDGKGRTKGPIGTIIAVTNRSQSMAAKHLEASGFKLVAENEKTSGYGKCKTWICDYHRDGWPLWSKATLPANMEDNEKMIKDLMTQTPLGRHRTTTQLVNDPAFVVGDYVQFLVNNDNREDGRTGGIGHVAVVTAISPSRATVRIKEGGVNTSQFFANNKILRKVNDLRFPKGTRVMAMRDQYGGIGGDFQIGDVGTVSMEPTDRDYTDRAVGIKNYPITHTILFDKHKREGGAYQTSTNVYSVVLCEITPEQEKAVEAIKARYKAAATETKGSGMFKGAAMTQQAMPVPPVQQPMQETPATQRISPITGRPVRQYVRRNTTAWAA